MARSSAKVEYQVMTPDNWDCTVKATSSELKYGGCLNEANLWQSSDAG